MTFDEEWSIAGLSVVRGKGSLGASIWAEGGLILKHDYFELNSTVGFKAEGELDAEFLGGLYSIHCKANTFAEGRLVVSSNFVQASAVLTIHLQEYDDEGELVDTYDVDFEGCKKVTLADLEFQDCPETP